MGIILNYIVTSVAAEMSVQFRGSTREIQKNTILTFSALPSIKASALFSCWMGFVRNTKTHRKCYRFSRSGPCKLFCRSNSIFDLLCERLLFKAKTQNEYKLIGAVTYSLSIRVVLVLSFHANFISDFMLNPNFNKLFPGLLSSIAIGCHYICATYGYLLYIFLYIRF